MDFFDYIGDEKGDEPEFPADMLSEEEIEKWSTDEALTEIDKFSHLLEKGFPLQKSAVINNLPQFLSNP
jgi:hypothetical protein